MFKKILLSLMIGLFLVPNFAKADGGMMPHPNYWIYETGQKAAIVYQNGIETLVLQTSFQGDAKDFAYIVPTPAKPEVSKVSDDIFTNLAELTQQDYDAVPMMSSFGALEKTAEESVTVVEEKQVGMYEVKVLTATDATALYDWLKENDFTYPESKKYILDDYIQNKWFFTTAKISTSAITADVETKLKQGALTPLKFVFETENLVFPLKISAVVEKPKDIYALEPSIDQSQTANKMAIDYYPSSVPITLYIFADHKKEVSGFDTSFASWIKTQEIEKLAKDDNGNSWVEVAKGKMYLTKLTKYTTYEEMTNDLFADDAKNNFEVGVAPWSTKALEWLISLQGILFWSILIASGLFLILIYWQFTPRTRKCHIVCWIIQIASFVIVSAPLIIFYLWVIANLNFGNYSYTITNNQFMELIIATTFFVGIPIIMALIMLAERYVQRKRSERQK